MFQLFDLIFNVYFYNAVCNNLGFRNLSNKSFEGSDTVTTLLIIDTRISEFPGTIFEHMPNIDVLTIQKTTIKSISRADFKVSNLSTK